MSMVKTIHGPWLVEEDCAFQQIVIGEDAQITAPEGKDVTMTVGGVTMDMKPGRYSGDIRFSVTDAFGVDFWMGGKAMFQAVAHVTDGKLDEATSVTAGLLAGTVGEGVAEGVQICSRADNMNGIYVDGDGEYVINNAYIDQEGRGQNDFIGHAAGVLATGNSKVTINDSTFITRGAARGAIGSAANSVLTVNNSTVRAYNGSLPADYKDTIVPGDMVCVPWMLGLRGNCRATNLLDYGVSYWNNCKLYSEGWGVLSTDGVDLCKLYAKDCHIEITGNSGYGAFSIGECHDYFDNCTFKMTDYALIAANEHACGSFTNGTVVDSKRFGVMFFNNEGEIFVEDSTFNTEKTVFLVKGCAPQINVRNAKLNPANGKILQLFNCDDPGHPGGYYCDPVEADAFDPEHDRTKATPFTDVIARFADMDVNGSFYNGSSNNKGDTGPKVPMHAPPPPADGSEPAGPRGLPHYEGVRNLSVYFENAKVTGVITACKSTHRVEKVVQDNCEQLGEVDDVACPAINNGVNVYLDGKSVWNVTGTSYLTSLELAEGAFVTGVEGKSVVMTVDGVETPIAAGSYKGNITVELA